MKKILATLLFIEAVLLVNAQNWFPVGNGLRSGNNRDVNTLVAFNGNLIAGGNFEKIEGNDTLMYISQWDGTSWKQMGQGGGFSNYVHALTVFNGELYAGGEMFRRFNDDGTTFTGGIAKWNGSKWMPVAGLSNGVVFAMAEYDNQLFLARREEIIDQNSGNTIAIEYKLTSFDGTTFTDIPSLFKGPENYTALEDLTVYDNKLVIVGRFDSIDNIPARMAVAYDGTAYATLNFPVEGRTVVTQGVIGIYGYAKTCEVYDNKLFVGGLLPTFNFPNTNEPTSLASFDGTTWVRHQFDENFGNTVNDLVVKNDTMFVLGEYGVNVSGNILFGVTIFNTAETPPFTNTNFYPTIPGQGGRVNAGVVFNNTLYVGGNFQRAGSNEVNNIARLDPTATIIVSTEELVKNELVKVFPNPAGNVLNITGSAPQFKLQLTDITGKIIYAETVNSNNSSINVSSYPKGMYFLQIDNKAVYKVVVE